MPQAPLPPNVMNAAGAPPGAGPGGPPGADLGPGPGMAPGPPPPGAPPGLPQEQGLPNEPAGAMGQLPPGVEQKLERIATILISITPDLLAAAMSEGEGAGAPQGLPASLTDQGMPTDTLASRGMPTQIG